MTDIKIGDVVKVKSGGPPMTVQNIGDYTPTGPSNGAMCVWFDGKTNKSHVFAVEVLEKTDVGFGNVRLSRG